MKRLKTVFELAKKNKNGVVVVKESGEAFVLLTLEDFQRISPPETEGEYMDSDYILPDLDQSAAKLTKEQLIDKINRDIAAWKTVQQENEIEDNFDFEEENTDKEMYLEPIETNNQPLKFV